MKFPLVVLLIAACSPRTERASHRWQIDFTEVVSSPLADTFDLLGAAVNDSGLALVWSASGVARVRFEAGEPESLCRGLGLSPRAAAFDGADAVQILGASAAHTAKGAVCTRHPIPFDTTGFIAAVWDSGAWVTLRQRDAGVVGLASVELTGTERWNAFLPRLVDSHLSTQPFALSSSVGGPIVYTQGPPFSWMAFDRQGRPRFATWNRGAAPHDSLGQDRGSKSADWYALPVLALSDSSYVQSFTDHRSDLRALARYDRQGLMISLAFSELPVTFVAASTGRPAVLAVRRTDLTELVWYEWQARFPRPFKGVKR